MYSAFRVRLLSQVQALPSLALSRPFSHAGVYVHFLRFIWLESLPRLINDIFSRTLSEVSTMHSYLLFSFHGSLFSPHAWTISSVVVTYTVVCLQSVLH